MRCSYCSRCRRRCKCSRANACDAVIAVDADADANAVGSNACDAVIAVDADTDAVNSELAAVTRSQSRAAAAPTGAIDAMMHDTHIPQVANNSPLGTEMATNTVPIIGMPASETVPSASSSRQRPPATGQEDSVQRRRAKQDA